MNERPALPHVVVASRVVAVLRAPYAMDWTQVVDVLVEHGITGIELTLTTPNALDGLEALSARFGTDAAIGVGTVTTADQARHALDAGASFLVSPGVVPAALELSVSRDIPMIGGAFTPTEVMSTWGAGATAVKIFPASSVGPGYLRELRGPFPDLVAMPSGGVGVGDIAPWLAGGAAAVSLGGWLLGDALTGDLGGLRERCRLVHQQVADVVRA